MIDARCGVTRNPASRKTCLRSGSSFKAFTILFGPTLSERGCFRKLLQVIINCTFDICE